jgi:uncharacterized metal-binding protein YceD (DUF177 family)
MSDPDPDASPGDLPHHIMRLAEGGTRGPKDFVILPMADERTAIARHLGIPGLRKLRFAGRLTPAGRRDWTLEAHLGATAVQDCVVTLAPVVTRIDEAVLRRYLADLPAPGPGEVEVPEDDSVEDLPSSIDLCDVMIEALSLALPPFPRAPGAELGEITVTEPGADPPDPAALRPFAGLSDLRARLGRPSAPAPAQDRDAGANPDADTDE